MAFIYPTPLDPIDGVPYPVLFTKADLVADAAFAAATATDKYFRDTKNWKSVEIKMKATEGKQTETMIFDCDNVDPTATTDFLVSETSRWIWEVNTVTVFDFDGGSLKLSTKDGQLDPAEFNFNLRVPTSSVFDNTQRGTVFNMPTTTDQLSISFWLQYDPTDTSHEVFILDWGPSAPGLEFWHESGPDASLLVWNGGVSSRITTPITDKWNHYTCVYDNTNKFIELFVNGVSQGQAVVPSSGGSAGVTIDPSTIFRLIGYDDNDATWRLKGKIANFEMWTEALDAADALALYKAGYYQKPENIVNKTLLTHWMMGDHPSETTASAKDIKGLQDITYVGTVTHDTDVPVSLFPYSRDFSTAIEAYELSGGDATLVADAWKRNLAADTFNGSTWPLTTTVTGYALIVDTSVVPDMVKTNGFVNNFDLSKDIVFTFDITEYTEPDITDDFEIRVYPFSASDAISFFSGAEYKVISGTEVGTTLTLTAAEMASGSATAPTVLGIGFAIYSASGSFTTAGTMSIDNVSITNE